MGFPGSEIKYHLDISQVDDRSMLGIYGLREECHHNVEGFTSGRVEQNEFITIEDQ